MRGAVVILGLVLALSACGKADRQADALDRAASQSDPAAAETLRNRADMIRDGETSTNVADPASPAQDALQAAGNSAAENGVRSTR